MNIGNKVGDEVIDYRFDFAARIDAGDVLASATATVRTGDVTSSRCTVSGTAVIFWLSGGTPISQATVMVETVTTGGRTLAELAFVNIIA